MGRFGHRDHTLCNAGIKPNDLNEVKKLGKPSDIIKLVFDLVGLLKMEKMVKTETAEITMGAAAASYLHWHASSSREEAVRTIATQASARKNGPSDLLKIASRTCRAACSPTRRSSKTFSTSRNTKRT